jgi:hypothetical protein
MSLIGVMRISVLRFFLMPLLSASGTPTEQAFKAGHAGRLATFSLTVAVIHILVLWWIFPRIGT